MRCEDYPCCGHTDGLGCDYVPDYAYINQHAGCDHEIGDCWQNDDWDDDFTDAEADADTLASAGWGTDEDYGYYGEDAGFEDALFGGE